MTLDCAMLFIYTHKAQKRLTDLIMIQSYKAIVLRVRLHRSQISLEAYLFRPFSLAQPTFSVPSTLLVELIISIILS